MSKSESYSSDDQDDESNSIKTEWIENDSKAKQSSFRSPSAHDQSNLSVSDISNNIFTPSKNDTPSAKRESSNTPKVIRDFQKQEEANNQLKAKELSVIQLHSVKKPSSEKDNESVSSDSSKSESSKSSSYK